MIRCTCSLGYHSSSQFAAILSHNRALHSTSIPR